MTQTIVADLHNHTRASDGDFTPSQLVHTAHSLGVTAIGITDHDTLGGLAEGVAAGRDTGVQVVPGVEVSIRFAEALFTGTLHLLCYFLPHRLSDAAFVQEFEHLMAGGRGDALVKARVAKINSVFGPESPAPLLNRPLAFEDISAFSHNASRRHFALALSERFSIRDKAVINRIIGNDSPAYLPSGVALDTVAPFIRQQGLVSVLAHPAAGSFPGPGHYREVLPPVEIVEQLLPRFLAAGVQGIEVYYPGHTPSHQEQVRAWATTHRLLVTGGSDCHDAEERPPAVAGIGQADFNRFAAALT